VKPGKCARVFPAPAVGADLHANEVGAGGGARRVSLPSTSPPPSAWSASSRARGSRRSDCSRFIDPLW